MLYIFLKSVKHPPCLPIRIMKRKKGNKTMLRKSPMGRWEKEGKLINLPTRCLKLQKHFEPRLCHTFNISGKFCAAQRWNNSCQQTKKMVKLWNKSKSWQKTLFQDERRKGAFYETQKNKNTNFHGDFFKSLCRTKIKYAEFTIILQNTY
jgi:hypothetical protein